MADADTGRVLGVHVLADGGGEMMLAATYAIKAGFTVDELADTWAPYLTMAEGLRASRPGCSATSCRRPAALDGPTMRGELQRASEAPLRGRVRGSWPK